MKTIFKMIVLLGFVAAASLVWAEMYKWVDEKGTVHFTEDPATIPEKYKDKAKARLTDEDLMTPEDKAKASKDDEKRARRRQLDQSREDYQKGLEKIKEERRKKAAKEAEAERLDIRVSTRRYGTGHYVFTIEARNDGNRVKSISFMDFTLITEDNRSLSPETGTLTRSTQIQPGTRYSGTVEFSAPKRAKTLVYNPTGETFSVP
jgi:hypothetical protein